MRQEAHIDAAWTLPKQGSTHKDIRPPSRDTQERSLI